jgi:hypothetical protein
MKLSDIITPVSTKYGAPMGRPNVGQQPITVVSGRNGRIVKKNQIKVYDKRVPLTEGYDQGGAYWGIGPELRVRFTKDLSYIEYYRIKH